MTRKQMAISAKGLAMVKAIQAGLLPETPNGWDDTLFNLLWDVFEEAAFQISREEAEKVRKKNAQHYKTCIKYVLEILLGLCIGTALRFLHESIH